MLDEPEGGRGNRLVKKRSSFLLWFFLVKKNPNPPIMYLLEKVY